MKHFVWGAAVLAAGLLLSACGGAPPEASPARSAAVSGEMRAAQDRKILIAYFSLAHIVPDGADASTHATPSSGNTETAAKEIQRQVGGDLFAIRTERSYPVLHREGSAVAKEEIQSDARPRLTTTVPHMEEYDTVYIGYPLWWYMEPMAVRTFIESYDFQGKTVIPFCTSMGAGVERSEADLRQRLPGAQVLSGVTLPTGRDNGEAISRWLTSIGMK